MKNKDRETRWQITLSHEQKRKFFPLLDRYNSLPRGQDYTAKFEIWDYIYTQFPAVKQEPKAHFSVKNTEVFIREGNASDWEDGVKLVPLETEVLDD